MASNAATECPVCNEDFNETERCPRNLPCSHSLCSDCLQNLIVRNTKICPFCRQRFNANSVREIGVNIGLLDVLKLLREMEMKANSLYRGQDVTHLNWRELLKKEHEEIAKENISKCQVYRNHINSSFQRNHELRGFLLQVNHVMQNEIIVKCNEIIEQNVERIKALEEKSNILIDQNRIISVKERKMQDTISQLAASDGTKGAGSLFDKVEAINSDAKKWLLDVKELLAKVEKKQQRIEEAAKNTHGLMQNLRKLLNSVDRMKEEKELISNMRAMAIPDTPPPQITEGSLHERQQKLERLRQNRVFAHQQIGGKARFAKLSYHDENRFCLHHLKDQDLPPKVYFWKYDKVLSMVDPSSRLAFLELSDVCRRVLGRLYIRLAPETKRATQFSVLCTADKGPTYTNTGVLDVWARDSAAERVWFGDYEQLKGKGGRAVVPDVCKEEGGPYMRPWVAGTVVGRWPGAGETEAAQFFILTKNNPVKNAKWCFGMVEEGLEILTEAVSYLDVKSIFISDSGLVVPL